MQTSRIFIGFKNSYQEQIFSSIVAGCGVQASQLENVLKANFDLPLSPQLVIADLGYFQERDLSVSSFAANLAAKHPSCKLILQNDNTWLLSALEKSWAASFGVKHLLPRLHTRRTEATILPVGALISQLTGLLFSAENTKSFLSVLKNSERVNTEKQREAMELSVLEKLDQQRIELSALSQAVAKNTGFKVVDRTWRFKKFPQVLQGDEATQWLCDQLTITPDQAVCLGEILRRARVFEHVAQEHAFKNEGLFYRFTDISQASELVATKNLLSDVFSKTGFNIANRAHLATEYSNCFIGQEAVDWFFERYACSRNTAVQVGQLLADLGFIFHVTGEHDFKDAPLFYQAKGIKLPSKSASVLKSGLVSLGRVAPAPA